MVQVKDTNFSKYFLLLLWETSSDPLNFVNYQFVNMFQHPNQYLQWCRTLPLPFLVLRDRTLFWLQLLWCNLIVSCARGHFWISFQRQQGHCKWRGHPCCCEYALLSVSDWLSQNCEGITCHCLSLGVYFESICEFWDYWIKHFV